MGEARRKSAGGDGGAVLIIGHSWHADCIAVENLPQRHTRRVASLVGRDTRLGLTAGGLALTHSPPGMIDWVPECIEEEPWHTKRVTNGGSSG
jgi:hypothetical protein